METIDNLRYALQKIKETPIDVLIGLDEPICHLIKEFVYWTAKDTRRFLEPAFRSWEGYSGDINYPVTDTFYTDPLTAYDRCGKWTGTYGENRQSLLDHLIAVI